MANNRRQPGRFSPAQAAFRVRRAFNSLSFRPGGLVTVPQIAAQPPGRLRRDWFPAPTAHARWRLRWTVKRVALHNRAPAPGARCVSCPFAAADGCCMAADMSADQA
jgi:hypothetical protein